MDFMEQGSITYRLTHQPPLPQTKPESNSGGLGEVVPQAVANVRAKGRGREGKSRAAPMPHYQLQKEQVFAKFNDQERRLILKYWLLESGTTGRAQVNRPYEIIL
ncbi:MAG: hypothetical protein AAF921_00785 [Cyanobacteria bacterium P01_D01_bin.44]